MGADGSREKISNWLFAIGGVSIACALLPVNGSFTWVGVLILVGVISIAGSHLLCPWTTRFSKKSQSDINQDQERNNR